MLQLYWPFLFALGISFLTLYRAARRQGKSLRSGAIAYLLALSVIMVSRKIMMKTDPMNVAVQGSILWVTFVVALGLVWLGLRPYITQKEQQFQRKIYTLFSIGLIPTLLLIHILPGAASLIPLCLFVLLIGYYFFRHHVFDPETHRFILR